MKFVNMPFKYKYSLMAMPSGTVWMNEYEAAIEEIIDMVVDSFTIPSLEECSAVVKPLIEAMIKDSGKYRTYEDFIKDYPHRVPTKIEIFIGMRHLKISDDNDIWMNELQTAIDLALAAEKDA